MALLLYLGYQIKELITLKIKKTYRLNETTIEQIQALKEYLSSKGFDLSDSQVIQKAVNSYMDTVALEVDPQAVIENEKECFSNDND